MCFFSRLEKNAVGIPEGRFLVVGTACEDFCQVQVSRAGTTICWQTLSLQSRAGFTSHSSSANSRYAQILGCLKIFRDLDTWPRNAVIMLKILLNLENIIYKLDLLLQTHCQLWDLCCLCRSSELPLALASAHLGLSLLCEHFEPCWWAFVGKAALQCYGRVLGRASTFAFRWWGSSPAGLGWLNSAQVSPAAEQSHTQVSAEERWQIAV